MNDFETSDGASLTERDIRQLEAVLTRESGADRVRLGDVRVLERREETRLRFNAPTPVVWWRISAMDREIDLFHWVEDDEWEVVEVR